MAQLFIRQIGSIEPIPLKAPSRAFTGHSIIDNDQKTCVIS